MFISVSMIYLSLSEATALNFLGPLGSLILTRYLSLATVELVDCLGAVGALVGVVLVVQPEDIFGTRNVERNVSNKTGDLLNGLIFSVLGICGGIVSDKVFIVSDSELLDMTGLIPTPDYTNVDPAYWNESSSINERQCVLLESSSC